MNDRIHARRLTAAGVEEIGRPRASVVTLDTA